MNTLASAACALLLLGSGASAQTLDDLKKDGNGGSTDNILTYGMGYHQQRYSPLKQINKQTVKRLVPVWNLSLDNNWGEQAQPIVYNGVMYVTNAKATVAIDVATGKQIWKQTGQCGDARQESDAAMGGFLQAGSASGLMGLCRVGRAVTSVALIVSYPSATQIVASV